MKGFQGLERCARFKTHARRFRLVISHRFFGKPVSTFPHDALVVALFASLALILPRAATAGVFYNNRGNVSLEHPKDAMAQAFLVRVKPEANARFYDNVVKAECPSLTPSCQRRGYLVPGDIAVAADTTGAFTIVEFVGPKGAVTNGAIESRFLERIETPRPSPQDWIGDWQSTDEQEIVITRTGDPSVLSFRGDATWGAHDPFRVQSGGINDGEFAAFVKPVGAWGGFVADLDDALDTKHGAQAIGEQKGLNTDWTRYVPADAGQGEYTCRASFRLLGPYLLAYTPIHLCGGMNVTFTGVYRRIAPPRG